MELPVYLDNHATTRVDPRVVDAMVPYFSTAYGNAASRQHAFGWAAEAAVTTARGRVAALIGADAAEIIFTSGATESVNLAIKGVAEGLRSRGKHIVTSVTEHRAVLDTCRRLEQYGYTVTYLPVDPTGKVLPTEVDHAITSATILVSIMAANNEIGTIAPLEEIGTICRHRGVLFHTDAAQAAGKIPLDLRRLNVDLLTLSAHKMYGPKGIGALYVRTGKPGIPIVPQIDGGGHERGLRSGTLNVPAIAGFGEAARIAREEMTTEARRTAVLRDTLIDGLRASLGGIRVNGHPADRLPNNANITFEGIRADRLMMDMKDIAVSSGSACSSASPEPSHVLKALGLSDEDMRSTLRFGLGKFTTEEEIAYAVRRITESVRRERERVEVTEGIHVH